MKHAISIVLLIFFFGSCNQQSQKEENKNQVIIECQKILKEWNIEAAVSLEDELEASKLSIEIKEPTITNKDHAAIIVSCLIAKHTFLPKAKNIIFDISSHVDNVKSQLTEINYSQQNMKSLTTLFGDAPLLRLNEYCIKNFTRNSAYHLENLMTKNHKLEKWSIEGSFYQLLYQFFKESKGYEKNQNATLTMFFLYLTTSDFLKGTEYEYLANHLKNLWAIMRNDEIKDFEKPFNAIINQMGN